MHYKPNSSLQKDGMGLGICLMGIGFNKVEGLKKSD